MRNELSPLQRLAKWCATTPTKWPEIAIDRARGALLDTLSVSIAGKNEPAVQKLSSVIQAWGAGSTPCVGSPLQLSTPYAAKLGGTMAHALDFDDNFDPAKAHASAVLCPALWSVGADIKASVAQLLDAYIVGLQILGRVGQAVNPYHRNYGWHATSTLGTIGAAAAVSRLLQLDATQAAHALSLATSYAGGFMSQFGTMTKPLHAGMAAMGGVQAAQLAATGFTAGEAALDGSKGLRTLMVGQNVDELAERMPDAPEHGQTMRFDFDDVGEPLLIVSSGLKVKRYPNCGSVHRALDGLLELRELHGLTADDVEHITVRAPSSHLANLMYHDPQDAMQAKFCMAYNLSVGLHKGMVVLADFEDDVLHKAEIRETMQCIECQPVDLLESQFPTQVRIHCKSGKEHNTEIEMPLGSSSNPMNKLQLKQKYYACVVPFIGQQSADELYQLVQQDTSTMDAVVRKNDKIMVLRIQSYTHSHVTDND